MPVTIHEVEHIAQLAHLEFSSEPTRLLAPDESALRQLLERLKIPFQPTTAIFRPGRFARGDQSVHELGTSHRH